LSFEAFNAALCTKNHHSKFLKKENAPNPPLPKKKARKATAKSFQTEVKLSWLMKQKKKAGKKLSVEKNFFVNTYFWYFN
jgi:hypothetical protein